MWKLLQVQESESTNGQTAVLCSTFINTAASIILNNVML